MNELQKAQADLERLYTSTTEADIPVLERLRRYMAYAAFLKENPILSRLTASIRERITHQSITDLQKSMHDPVYRTLSEMHHQAPTDEDEEKTFPMNALVGLEEGLDNFTTLGDEDDVEKFKKKELRVKRETSDREDWYSTTISGHHLLMDTEYIYPRQLPKLHAHLLQELDAAMQTGKLPTYFSYDAEAGFLHVHGKPVQIMARKTPNNAHYLLQYLFANDPTDQHMYGEMEEDQVLLEESSWNAYYRAATDIQKKVEAATGIPDFLDFSTGKSLYVRVSPKHALVSESFG